VLSLVVTAGPNRYRVHEVLAASRPQLRPGDELLVLDLAPDGAGLDLRPSERRVTPRAPRSYGAARASAARAATGDLLLFLEDHCRPEPEAFDALRAAAEGVAVLGMELRCGNPQTLVARGAHLGAYASVDTIPGHNVAYDRKVLLDVAGDRLDDYLEVEYVLHWELARRGHAARAVAARAAHDAPASAAAALRTTFLNSASGAAARGRIERWSFARRVLYALAAPVRSPVIRFRRLLHLQGVERGALAYAGISYVVSAVGESVGALGGGSGRRALMQDLNVERPRR
jgi:hypothetical protein